jgi:hypothetical protein
MKTQFGDSKEHKLAARAALLGAVALFVISALSSGAVFGAGYNDVQVFATTTADLSYSFTFTAYNLTGSMVASYQSSFPAAAFELPSGEYLFTVSAVHQQIYPPCIEICPLEAGAGATTGVTTGTGKPASLPAILYRPPSSEYGYTLASVSSSQTLNINLMNVTQFPTSKVTVKVSYVNGTAAEGASVSASVVGQYYYWWGQNSNLSMWGQTDSNGMVTLVLPQAPAVVTAWKWVPVILPAANRTITTNVGGQEVNITVYWQPTYVGLSASGLVIPPANSVDLTLKYQQPNYWLIPAGTEYAGAQGGPSGATVSNQPTATPAIAAQPAQSGTGQQSPQQYYLPSQIPQLQSGSGTTEASSGPPLELLALTGVVGAVLGVAFTAVFLRRKGPPMATGP